MSKIELLKLVISLSGIIAALVKGALRSKPTTGITVVLAVFWCSNFFSLANNPYLEFLPTILIAVYFGILQAKPDFFNIPNYKNGNELLQEIFKNIHTQGPEAVKTFQIIALTYNGGNKAIRIQCGEFLDILIMRARQWIAKYYQVQSDEEEKNKCGPLANAAIITIANISVANNLGKGIEFIKNELGGLIINRASKKFDIVNSAKRKADQIMLSKKPDLEAYS